METHASDEISKERQRRSQHQPGDGGGGGDVDGLEGGMAAVRLGGREDIGGEEDAEVNEANGARSENTAEEEEIDDDDQDCDYVPENYHDENSKKHPHICLICICEYTRHFQI